MIFSADRETFSSASCSAREKLASTAELRWVGRFWAIAYVGANNTISPLKKTETHITARIRMAKSGFCIQPLFWVTGGGNFRLEITGVATSNLLTVGFHIGGVDFHRDRAHKHVERKHEATLLFSADQDALCSCHRTACYAHPTASAQIRMGFGVQSLLQPVAVSCYV